MSLSCLIPIFNEGDRIASVLSAVVKTPSISQIIVVDDGSTDSPGEIISRRFPQVTLLRLNRNHGKSAAVFHGLKSVKSSRLLLLDGDMLHLQSAELETACRYYLSHPRLDSLILRSRGEDRFAWQDNIVRNYIVQSGNRLVRTSDLHQVATLSPHKYQLEVAINQFMIEHGRQVEWMRISALNLHKTTKLSSLTGWLKDIRMELDILIYLGPFRLLHQMFFFCRDQANS